MTLITELDLLIDLFDKKIVKEIEKKGKTKLINDLKKEVKNLL